MSMKSDGSGSFRELANDLLADAYPEVNPAELHGEAVAATEEVNKIDQISARVGELGEAPSESETREEAVGDPTERLEADVLAASAGDREAVARVLTTIRPLVVRYCRARLGRDMGHGVNADDVAQEVCLAVLSSLPSYVGHSGSFLAFVYGISAHKVIDAYRLAPKSRSGGSAPDAADTANRVLFDLDDSSIRQAFDQLPEKYREILVLRLVMGLSAEDTAEIVGLTPGAVRVAQHRGLARMQRLGALAV